MRAFLCICSAVLSILLVGCGQGGAKFVGTDVTGASFGQDFHLTDHNGKPRSLVDFRGKVVAIFFGYTQCPDVCPTTMSEMAEVMKQLGADADKFQVLFVTLDPERDTPQLLASYVPQFNPTFLGLYGDAAATQKVAKDFRIVYEKRAGTTPTSYTLDHTSGMYIFDNKGRLRLFQRYGQKPDAVAADVRELLAGK